MILLDMVVLYIDQMIHSLILLIKSDDSKMQIYE